MTKLLTATALVLAVNSAVSTSVAAPSCSTLLGNADTQTEPWFEAIRFDDVEHTLRFGKIVEVISLHQALFSDGKKAQGTTEGLALLTFEDGTKAVWKPGIAGEVEASAYRLARAVGSRLIPPTVLKTLHSRDFASDVHEEVRKGLDEETGSLQFFVKTQRDLTKMTSEERDEVMNRVPAVQLAERDFFNFVFGNWDRHWANILIDDSNSIVQIDNGAIRMRQMARFGELPFILRLSFSEAARSAGAPAGPFPFDQAVTLNHPEGRDIVALMKEKAQPAELAKFILLRTQPYASKDLSMKFVEWDNAFWIQSIGYQNYGEIRPPLFPERVVRAYSELTFEKLRRLLPENIFEDKTIHEMLLRRDEIVAAAHKFGVTPR